MKFDSWESAIAYLDNLGQRLRESGASDAAEKLHSILHESAWTTSSEMLGEIKLTLAAVRREKKGGLSSAILKDIDAFIAFIDKAWKNANR
jgi:hypothetical protein